MMNRLRAIVLFMVVLLGTGAAFVWAQSIFDPVQPTPTSLVGSAVITPSIGPSASQQHTLPAVTSDTVALLAATQSLSNKTYATPAFTGSMTATGKVTTYNNASASDGQLLIGGTAAGNWTAGTLTGSPAVTVTNGNNSITLKAQAFNAAGTAQANIHFVYDTVTLAVGTATVTLTGSAAFSSNTAYSCAALDTTAANPIQLTQTSGSSITFTGTGTDVLRYVCFGN